MLITVVTNSILVIVAAHIKTKFEILGNTLKNEKFQYPNRNYQVLRNYCIFHQKLISISDILNEVFKPIFFIQMILAVLQMCTVFFQVLELSDTLNLLKKISYYSYIICVIIECFAYCCAGQFITDESFNISFAIQQSSWYNLNRFDRKILIIILARAQNALEFSSGPFVASFKTFLIVRIFKNFVFHIIFYFII